MEREGLEPQLRKRASLQLAPTYLVETSLLSGEDASRTRKHLILNQAARHMAYLPVYGSLLTLDSVRSP